MAPVRGDATGRGDGDLSCLTARDGLCENISGSQLLLVALVRETEHGVSVHQVRARRLVLAIRESTPCLREILPRREERFNHAAGDWNSAEAFRQVVLHRLLG